METKNTLLENGINTISESFGMDEPELVVADGLTALLKYQDSFKKQHAALREIPALLEKALEEEGPYIMTTNDGLKTWDREVNREEMLQHHIEAAIQQINELMEGE